MSDVERFRLRYSLTDAERDEATAVAATPTGSLWLGRITLLGILALMLAAVGLKLWGSTPGERLFLIVFVPVCFAVVLIWTSKQKRRAASAGGESEVVVSDAGLDFGGDGPTRVFVPFCSMVRWHESDRLFVLIAAGGTALPVPKRAMDNGWARTFRRLLADGVARTPRFAAETSTAEAGGVSLEWTPSVGDALRQIYASRVTRAALPLAMLGMSIFALAVTAAGPQDRPAVVGPLGMTGIGAMMGVFFWSVLSLVFAFNLWSRRRTAGRIRVTATTDGLTIADGATTMRAAWQDVGPVRRAGGGVRIGGWRSALHVPRRAAADAATWRAFVAAVPADKWRGRRAG